MRSYWRHSAGRGVTARTHEFWAHFLPSTLLRGGLIAAGIISLSSLPSVRGDILSLKNGGTIEGEVLEHTADSYTVRTVVGTVKLPADMVDKVEASPSPFQEYDARRRDVGNTPEDQFKLAQWCDERGLAAEKLVHLKLAVELDPDFEPARRLLGHVRVGETWIDGRTTAERPGGNSTASKPADAAAKDAGNRDDEKLIKAVQNGWQRKISAIKSSLLDSSVDRLVKQGRGRILEIKDPLAIVPLTRILSRANVACRELLVEVLGNIEHDESTLNLAVIALVDSDAVVRDAALTQLERRNDERVPAQFRKALASGDDALIRRAAAGLGRMKRKEAVPELINVLTAKRWQMVDVQVRKYFGEFPQEFSAGTRIQVGQSATIFHTPQIGVGDATGIVTVQYEKQMQNVKVLRTEVRDALKEITGIDDGFDADAWRQDLEKIK